MNRRRLSPRLASALVLATSAVTVLTLTMPAQADTAPAAPAASTSSSPVVVVLKDQLAATPAGRTHGSARRGKADQEQNSVLGKLPGQRPGKVRQFATGNAFAATVTPSQASALSADPAVAAVVPDVNVPVGPATPAVTATTPSSASCPSNPANPLLEPEGLSLIHAASADGSPSAADLANGSGVTVGVLAEGDEINVPDFVRPNGKNVVTDEEDFTGNGVGREQSQGESNGDITTIAAQGVVHDLHTANPAVPAGCTVRIEGVAPDVDIVHLDILGLFTPLSDILQGIDYAANTAHVDVLNESIGVDQVPNEGARNAIELFNDQAVAAGVTVVAASGDSGTGSTEAVPAADPNVISVGATTALRTLAQLGQTGQAGTWTNDNIGEFSSSGFTSTGSTINLVAPGFEGWIANQDSTGGLETFGGTSEATPFVSGTAALVVQAYRQTHRGASPSPALVKTLLTSTAQDLGASAQDQGAGLVDARAAVEAALTYPKASGPIPASVASHITLSTGQINLSGGPGSTASTSDVVTNVGTRPLTVAPSMRQAAPSSTQTQNVTLTSGTSTTINVNPGSCDQFETQVYNASIDHGTGPIRLFDPSGALVNMTIPQGAAAFGTLYSRECTAGTWTVVFPPALTGPTTVVTTSYVNQPIGQLDTRAFTLAPGASRKVDAKVTVPADGGDTADALVFATSAGDVTTVPVTVRTVLSLPNRSTATLHGTFTGGNGRNTFGDEQRFVYAVNVPANQPAVNLAFSLNLPAGEVADGVGGTLVAPNGEIADQTPQNVVLLASLGLTTPTFDLTSLAPQKGRWLVVLHLLTSKSESQGFTAAISTTSPAVATSTALPTSDRQVLTEGKSYEIPVTVQDTGVNPLTIQADPRTTKLQNYQLVLSLSGSGAEDSEQQLPTNPFLTWQVPLGTKSLTTTSVASVPTQVSLMSPGNSFMIAGSPQQLQQGSLVSTATISEATPTVTPGLWPVSAAQVGPFPTLGSPQSTTLTASVLTDGFDRTMVPAADDTTDIGADPYLPAIDPTATAQVALLTAVPGSSVTFKMSITPTGKPGTVVHGVLNILTDSGATVVAVLPYSYTVGAPGKAAKS